MTKRAGRSVANDPGFPGHAEAKAGAICLVAKAWDYHVRVALGITTRRTSRGGAVGRGDRQAPAREAMIDCEHFFDGYKDNRAMRWPSPRPRYQRGRALGGAVRHQWRYAAARNRRIVAEVVRNTCPGTHRHSHPQRHRERRRQTLAAVRAGARQIQGALNGLGERCGNAN
jgi:2-isopropylmalate synthase